MNPINFSQTPAESIISLLTTVLKTKLLSFLLLSKTPLPIYLWNMIHIAHQGSDPFNLFPHFHECLMSLPI